MNCINFGDVIFQYNLKMELIGILYIKDYLEILKNSPNYYIIKEFLDARAKDRKVYWW